MASGTDLPDTVTQQNAADADKAAGIAQEMKEQSYALQKNIDILVKLVRGAGSAGKGSDQAGAVAKIKALPDRESRRGEG